MNFLIVIFGATGDLTKRKIIPALYGLYQQGVIHHNTPILCVARRQLSHQEFLKHLDMDTFVTHDKKDLEKFSHLIHYHAFDFVRPDIQGFKKYIRKINREFQCGNNELFYLAVSPELFEPLIKMIRTIITKQGWRRVVFEKPFGNDYASARKLNKTVTQMFKERDIYRIDHYLGKELVQNIMVLRFANSIFEQVWNNQFVDHVQITVSEKVGVEGRGGYYDNFGVVRDMVQNHLLQVLSLVGMECPDSLDADHIRNEKVKVFRSLADIRPKDVVLGQYTAGSIEGKKHVGYLNEPSVKPGSKIPTFAAVRAYVNTKRWKGVPFYLRTGKCMKDRYAELSLVLKEPECRMFCGVPANMITVRIQPDEGANIVFNAKKPGSGTELKQVKMDFCHSCEFGMNTPEAYELLLGEIIKGDQTLFTRWDGIEECWKYVEPLLHGKQKLYRYKAGADGPKEAEQLLKRDGRTWMNNGG